MSRGGFATGIE
eukprot:gene26798-biopygen17372